MLLAVGLLLAVGINAQKIIMKIQGVTVPEGEEIQAFDWKNTSPYPDGSIGGGGGGYGKADPGLIMVKKAVDKSTNKLMVQLAKAIVLPEELIFEFYANNTDKDPYYRIRCQHAVVKQFYYLAPECPTCIKLVHQVGFSPGETVKFENLLTGETNTWNIAENTTQ